MSESMLLYVAIFVFVMLLIGLGLTVWEFRYGQPRREDMQARKRDSTLEPQPTADLDEAAAR